MKYTIAVWVCWFMCVSKSPAQIAGKGFAQTTDPQNAFKINLFSSFYSTINLSYQHVLSNTQSLNITASYMDFDFYGSTENPVDSIHGGSEKVKSQRTQGFTVMPEFRYMLNGRGLSGVYTAPFIRYAYYEYAQVAIYDSIYIDQQTGYQYIIREYRPDFYAYHTVTLGCTIGKQILFKNKVSIDFFCGPAYSILVSSNKTIRSVDDVVIGPGIPGSYIKGLGLRAGITVGFTY